MGDPISRYQPIDPSLFLKNREKLAEALPPNALVVLHANDLMPKNGDAVMPFVQNSDLFYLTGIHQEETILLLYPDAVQEQYQSILFIKKGSPATILWEGGTYSLEGAANVAGMATVRWLEDFPRLFRSLMTKATYVYLNSNEYAREEVVIETRDARFVQWCQKHYPLHQYRRLAPIMHRLRTIKSAEEVALIRKATDITHHGFLEMLPHVKPGVMEYELEASLSSSYLRRGSRGFAYAPIIASGTRANILHYTANSQVCQEGELLLVDAAAEYGCYCADMTRTIPVSGRFSKRQKEVYNAVLHVLREAKALLKPGLLVATYQEEVGRLMTEELLKLRLLTPDEVAKDAKQRVRYRKYFMHGISHHLGLDVHDPTDSRKELVEGMVLTIEPGIYIPEEGLGVRLENDVHILNSGVEDLMEEVPIEIEVIEESMHNRQL